MFVDSCGVRVDPEAYADPFVAAVMDEVGIDLRDHQSKAFDDLEDEFFDVIVSLSPEAHHRAIDFAHGRAVEIEYWPTFDPTLADGSREAMLAAYRGVRDALDARIRQRFPVGRTFGG